MPNDKEWIEAIDHELVVSLQSPIESFEDPKKAINDLINWHVSVSLDPRCNGGFVLKPQYPDAYAVIEQDGRIGYTAMVLIDGIPESQADETARQLCHEHINDCAQHGVEGAGLWVVRPIKIGSKEPKK